MTLPDYQGLYFQGVGANVRTEAFGRCAYSAVTWRFSSRRSTKPSMRESGLPRPRRPFVPISSGNHLMFLFERRNREGEDITVLIGFYTTRFTHCCITEIICSMLSLQSPFNHSSMMCRVLYFCIQLAAEANIATGANERKALRRTKIQRLERSTLRLRVDDGARCSAWLAPQLKRQVDNLAYVALDMLCRQFHELFR